MLGYSNNIRSIEWYRICVVEFGIKFALFKYHANSNIMPIQILCHSIRKICFIRWHQICIFKSHTTSNIMPNCTKKQFFSRVATKSESPTILKVRKSDNMQPRQPRCCKYSVHNSLQQLAILICCPVYP